MAPEQDDNSKPADETETVEQPTGEQQPNTDAKDDDARKGGDKAVLADLAKERKSRQALEKKLQEIEDAKLSEVERAKKEADTLRTELAQAQADVLRSKIAVKHGISAEDAELFLTASDEDQLIRQAERLSSRLAPAGDSKTPRRPAPDKSQGPRAADQPAGALGAAEAAKRFGQKQTA